MSLVSLDNPTSFQGQTESILARDLKSQSFAVIGFNFRNSFFSNFVSFFWIFFHRLKLNHDRLRMDGRRLTKQQ